MAAILIAYYDIDRRHVTLNSDGSIELHLGDGSVVTVEYPQASILKKMILAEAEIARK